MEIQENNVTGGFWCTFQKESQYYYADISYTLDRGPECMIFRCDKNGKISNWDEVFVRYYDSVTENNLRDSIKSFMAQ